MQKVNLRKLRKDDKYRLVAFANNPNISMNLRDAFPNPYTLANAEVFLETEISKETTEVFAIEFEDIYVGHIGLYKGTDVYRKSAEMGYLLDETYWNRGIMTQAVDLMCNYGFNNLDIIRIYACVFEYNTASQRVLEKCGFNKEAVFRKAVIKNGRLYDEYRYSKLFEYQE